MNPSLNDFPGHLRPAQVGDLCVLLEPQQQAQRHLCERQNALQRRFGGSLVARLHLTCQRCTCQEAHQVQALVAGLAEVVAQSRPFTLQAIALTTLYVPVLETNILKWQIEVNDALRQFVGSVRRVLLAQGSEPHYAADFIPDLVAALKDVPALSQQELAQETGLPYPLFETGQVVVSRIQGPDEFTIEGAVGF